MAYQTEFVADFQSHRTGLTIHAQYYDNAGATFGAAITSGIVETASGIYKYTATISDGFVGSIVLYNSADSNIRVAFSINPNELENTDVKISTRSSQISIDAIDTIVDSIILDTNELQSDWTNGGRLDTIIDAIKAITDVLPDSGALTTLLNNVISILNDTNELQSDWVDGGRLDNILDSRSSQSSVDNANTKLDNLAIAIATIDDFLDTEIADIKTKVDNLPIDPASASSIVTSFSNLTIKLRKYIQLLTRKDAAITTDNAIEVSEINADGGSGIGAFDNTTDSNEAMRDKVDDLNTLLLAGITVDSTTVTNIAKAVLKLDVSTIEDDVDAGQISLLAVVLGLLNSTLPEGGPWTIYKIGGGIYITRDVDEQTILASVVGVHS